MNKRIKEDHQKDARLVTVFFSLGAPRPSRRFDDRHRIAVTRWFVSSIVSKLSGVGDLSLPASLLFPLLILTTNEIFPFPAHEGCSSLGIYTGSKFHLFRVYIRLPPGVKEREIFFGIVFLLARWTLPKLDFLSC